MLSALVTEGKEERTGLRWMDSRGMRKVPIVMILQASSGERHGARVLALVNIVIHKVTHSFWVQLGMLQLRYLRSHRRRILSTIEISPIDKSARPASVAN
jgi:hypothetical protein